MTVTLDHRPRLLLVDDEPTNLQVLRQVLQQEYRLQFATDGQRALELAREHTPDLILLDVMMPNLDGYTTLSEIKKNENLNNIKIIFLSAKTGENDIKKGLDLGADAYMTKPYSIKKLTEKVEELLLYICF